MDIEASVERFITQNFYVGEDAPLTRETSLVDRGIIDSTGMLEVLAFLEREYGITIADEEVLPGNLGTISQIATFVSRKRGKVGIGAD